MRAGLRSVRSAGHMARQDKSFDTYFGGKLTSAVFPWTFPKFSSLILFPNLV